MQIQIDSTDETTTLDGVPVRRWNGVTAEGVRCIVFVHRIAVSDPDDHRDFDADLQEQLPPPRVVPLSAIL